VLNNEKKTFMLFGKTCVFTVQSIWILFLHSD